MSQNVQEKSRRSPRTDRLGFRYAPCPGARRGATVIEGWRFGVPPAFNPALDVQFGYFRKAGRWARDWSRGVPPCRAFAAGDVFYSPPAARFLRWDAALQIMVDMLEVLAATPDAPESGGVRAGVVEYRWTRFRGGAAVATETGRITQAEFEAMLRGT